MYKIHINDRNYTSWEIYDNNNLSKVNLNINPIENKLLSKYEINTSIIFGYSLNYIFDIS